MPGPPEDVPPSDLFLKLSESRPSEVVNFPRKTSDGKPIGTTRIQVLTGDDHEVAQIEAKRNLKERRKLDEAALASLDRAVLGDAVARELLAMACTTEKNHGTDDAPFHPRVFPGGEALGKVLTADETAVLFQTYLLVQAKYGPFEKTCQTEQDITAWIVRLVEGAADFPLGRVSSAHWAEVAWSLAGRAYLLSAVLASLWPSLPPSLKSRLGACSLDTGSFGGPAGSRPPGSTGSFAISDVTVTIEDAAQMAEHMKTLEEAANAALDEAEREISPDDN